MGKEAIFLSRLPKPSAGLSDDVKSVMKNFDQENHVRRDSSKHKRREDSDILIVVDILKEIKASNESLGEHTLILAQYLKTPSMFSTLLKTQEKHKKSWINLF